MLLQALYIILHPSVNSNSSCSPEAQLWSKSAIFVSCEREIWRMISKTTGQPFYASSSFLHHFVVICKFKRELRRSGNAQIEAKFVLTSVTLNIDLWPWSFARTSLLSMVINLENFMMMRWADRRTNRRYAVYASNCYYGNMTTAVFLMCIT